MNRDKTETKCQHLADDRDWYAGDGYVYACSCGHKFELCDLVNERTEAIQHAAAETARADKAEAELQAIVAFVDSMKTFHLPNAVIGCRVKENFEIYIDLTEETEELLATGKTPYEAIQAYLKERK